MRVLRLSPHLSWHARGDAAFSWHLITGDVCEMSRDVVALCLAFGDGGADLDAVVAAPPAGLDPVDARRFAEILVERRVLVARREVHPPRERAAALAPPAAPVAPVAAPASSRVEPPLPDEDLARDLPRWRPRVPRFAVYERRGDDAVIHGRQRVLTVEKAARFLDRADGSRPLGDLAPRSRWPALLELCRPELAALKLLPPGDGVPRWADSTMPWPTIDPAAFVAGAGAITVAVDPSNMAAYHAAIADAEVQFDETETTLSHLFREPHPCLGGATFGARLASALVGKGVSPSGARVVEVGGGLGWVGRALVEALAPSSYLVVDRSPALAAAQRRRGLLSVVGDAMHLPIADRSVDLLVSNEMAGDLGSTTDGNHGALTLVDEVARVLAPGGLAYISEFGHPTAAPVKSDHLDHDEFSIRFEDLRRRAVERGLTAELVPVPALVALDPAPVALVTTRASYAALRSLFRAHDVELPKRAWLLDELRVAASQAGLDLTDVHGIVTAPIGQRTMGLVPDEFWALIARRAR